MHTISRISRFFFAFFTILLSSCISVHADDVWLNTKSGVYHCPGTPWYANTKHGQMIEEEDAVSHGYRPSHGHACTPSAYAAGKKQISQSISVSTKTAADGDIIRVWVNTKSHVYHCPGMRYYGKTERGKYMSEGEALSSGNRPAYGRRCR